MSAPIVVVPFLFLTFLYLFLFLLKFPKLLKKCVKIGNVNISQDYSIGNKLVKLPGSEYRIFSSNLSKFQSILMDKVITTSCTVIIITVNCRFA